MSEEWEEYKQKEAYFDELAEQQREEDEHQMKEQEYIQSLESQNAELQRKLNEAVGALDKIQNIGSALNIGRMVSYGDWELRLIAKEALATIEGKEGV